MVVILALVALVQGAPCKVAVAQSSAIWGFEIQPNMTEEDNPQQAQEMHIASIDIDL